MPGCFTLDRIFLGGQTRKPLDPFRRLTVTVTFDASESRKPMEIEPRTRAFLVERCARRTRIALTPREFKHRGLTERREISGAKASRIGDGS